MKSLAIKYRPSSFLDVTEQSAIVTILEEQISTKTFKHAYLFCGPAGCGKTTAARIFANELNESKGNPIEIDAASNNGVENVREIIDNAKRKSLDSQYKIYIIDECHMMSNGAWNAMLKLLEEPPTGTIFIMCTTDPQKIPATILSRVQRYDFSKISLEGIERRLNFIITQENEEGNNIEPTAEAIQYIAKMAEGGMRDAITMLDKCVSLSPNLTVESVVKALGVVDYNLYFAFLYQMNTNGNSESVMLVEDVYNSGKDLKQFFKQFQYFVLDVCKYKLIKDFKYIAIPELEEYKNSMNDEDYEDCIKVLDWARKVNADIKWENNPKAFIQSAILVY